MYSFGLALARAVCRVNVHWVMKTIAMNSGTSTTSPPPKKGCEQSLSTPVAEAHVKVYSLHLFDNHQT